ncbi:MAG: hypothetical protein GY862_36435, partial [Gammaproteobacteria bacterium]|nr:hypothetical protein [Gammaproteobacteria bacterium]
SKVWSVAEGFGSGNTRDYLSIFNPNEETVTATLRLLGQRDPFPQEFPLTIPGKRKFPVHLHDYLDDADWNQPYGLTLEADRELVASMSHYDYGLGGGTLTMAIPSLLGETSGYVARGWNSEQSFEYVNILNPHEYSIKATLTIHYNTAPPQILPYGQVVYPGQRIGYRIDGLMNQDEDYVIEYKTVAANNMDWADLVGDWSPGTPKEAVVNFVHFDNFGSNGTQFVKSGAKRWEFAEGYRRSKPGSVQEYLLVYNSGRQDADVTVTLYYDDGKNPSKINLPVAAGSKDGLALHEDIRVRDRDDGGIFYGSVIESDVEVIPYFTHYDRSFGGSFALNGTARRIDNDN